MGYTDRSALEMVSLESAIGAMVRRGKVVEDLILVERPELIDLFLTYQNEAIEARKLLDSSLVILNPGAEILEVGGGILMLAIQLASEGFKVTTVEPVGQGFSGISYIMNISSEIARKEDLSLTLIESPIEDCRFAHKFDFIFSINVMEHLNDPFLVLKQIRIILKPDGQYRFLCPNYDFPYEPHFGKLLWRRRGGSFYLEFNRVRNLELKNIDSGGLYNSLNFITVAKLQAFSRESNLHLKFNSRAFHLILQRAISDPGLRARHKKFVPIVDFLSKLNFIGLSKLLPARFQPVMDVTLYN